VTKKYFSQNSPNFLFPSFPMGFAAYLIYCFNWLMQVSAKVDYGIRALLVLAAAYDGPDTRLLKSEEIATGQEIPFKFLEAILTELRHAGFVISQRGAVGGYRLSRNPSNIALAEVMRVLDGPLAAVRGLRPEAVSYHGSAENLSDVWKAVRVALRQVLETLTLADILNHTYSPEVLALLENKDANVSRPMFATE
jgi:Rrf2 family protein